MSSMAKDIMTRDVLTVHEDFSISELASFLNDNEITGAPVVDDDEKVVGVVSVVDIARAESEYAEDTTVWDAVVSHSYHLDWEQGLDDGIRIFHLKDSGVRVRDIMNPVVHSVEESTAIPEVVRKLLQYHLHRILVIEKGRLVGIISSSDLLQLLLDED